MRLFLSMEAQQCTENGLSEILPEIDSKLHFITDSDAGLEDIDNYGTEFRLLGIIPTCVSDDFLNALGWKERRLVRRKKREADIRLHMDYDRFINQTPENKRLMFIDIIVKSIAAVQEKSKGDFQGDKLVDDILCALDTTHEQLAALNVL